MKTYKIHRTALTYSIFRDPIRDPILKRDIQNFRRGNLKNHLSKWKNVTSDKIILDIIENGLTRDLINTPKSNSKFAFRLLHEEELIVKKEVALLKGKNRVAKANIT